MAEHHSSVDGRRLRVAPPDPPSDRPDMHRDLRERIEAGAYLVDPGLVAEAMIGRLARDRASAMFKALQPLDGGAVGGEQPDPASLLDHS